MTVLPVWLFLAVVVYAKGGECPHGNTHGQDELTERHHSDWVSLEVTVPAAMADDNYFFGEVPVLFGTPPQSLNTSINVQGSLLAAWSKDCVFCPGKTFDKSLSSTIKVSSHDNSPSNCYEVIF